MKQTRRGSWKPGIGARVNVPQTGFDLPHHTHSPNRFAPKATVASEVIFAPLDWPKREHHTELKMKDKRLARKGEPLA